MAGTVSQLWQLLWVGIDRLRCFVDGPTPMVLAIPGVTPLNAYLCGLVVMVDDGVVFEDEIVR